MKGMSHGPEVDVFSFGMVLYQVFHYTSTKTILHRSGYTIPDGHEAMLNGWRPAVSDSCPLPIRNIIQQCWEMNPADRPEFREIVPILKEFCSSVSDDSPSIKRVLNKIRFRIPTTGTTSSKDMSTSRKLASPATLKGLVKRNKTSPDMRKHDLQASRMDHEFGVFTMTGKMKRSCSLNSIRKALTPMANEQDSGATIRVRSKSANFDDVAITEKRRHDVAQFSASARGFSLNASC